MQLLAIEVLIATCIVGWGVRELWLLRRDKQQREAAKRAADPAADSGTPGP